MPDIIAFASTGVTYKNGGVTIVDILGNRQSTYPRVEHNVIVRQSGILDTRFDNCGVSGNYYFT